MENLHIDEIVKRLESIVAGVDVLKYDIETHRIIGDINVPKEPVKRKPRKPKAVALTEKHPDETAEKPKRKGRGKGKKKVELPEDTNPFYTQKATTPL